MPEEVVNLIYSILFFVLTLVFLIFTLIVVKNRKRYFENVLNEIEKNTRDYFFNIKIKDNNLFPYHKEIVSGIKDNFISNGQYDEVTNISIKRHISFCYLKVIYIVNDNLKYNFETKVIDGKEYIVIDKNIKTIEMLISNNKPSHYMLKYEFKVDDLGKVTYDCKEVKYDE